MQPNVLHKYINKRKEINGKEKERNNSIKTRTNLGMNQLDELIKSNAKKVGLKISFENVCGLREPYVNGQAVPHFGSVVAEGSFSVFFTFGSSLR